MRWLLLLIACLVSVPGLWAQDASLLPSWARPHAQAVAALPGPPGADAWVLLDRTELAYAGKGEVRTRRLRLVKILTERGLREGSFILSGLGGRTSTVLKLKGWNARPGGGVDRLEKDSVVTVDADASDQLSTQTLTAAVVPRVVKGSLVAFESLQVFRHPMGPTDDVYLLERNPVRRWELALAKNEGWFSDLKQVQVQMDLRHFSPWIATQKVLPGDSIAVDDLPALARSETARPALRNALPRVVVRFLDPDLADAPQLASWDSLATWIHRVYASRAQDEPLPGVPPDGDLPALSSVHRWMSRELSYRQVYLSPERGWIPEAAREVVRKRYGDCKDLTVCFLAQVGSRGSKGYPALARIGEGRIEPDEPVSPFCFNHVIAAVPLGRSLGLKAEVETPKGRFLLVDLTSRTTPLGYLGPAHAGGRILICTEAGGQWVEVPGTAILQPKLEARLEATATEAGALSGTLHFREVGDLGLRSTLLHRGAAGLREHLLTEVLDLPPSGRLEVDSVGDPLDLDSPFEVVLKLDHPTGFSLAGKEAALVRWGLPGAPPILQRSALPRLFPVEVEAGSSLDYQAVIRAPWPLDPVLPALDLDSPLRLASWKASSRALERGTELRLRFSQERRSYRSGYDGREQGMAVWKSDRAAMKRILDEGTVFLLRP